MAIYAMPSPHMYVKDEYYYARYISYAMVDYPPPPGPARDRCVGRSFP